MSISKQNIILLLLATFILTIITPFLSMTAGFKILLILIVYLFIFSFSAPKIGLLLFILIRPCLDIFTDQAIISIFGYNLNFASLLALLVLILSFFVVVKNLKNFSQLPLKFHWLAFIILAFISLFFSFDTKASLAEWLRLLSIMAVYLSSIFLFSSKEDLPKLIKTIIASAVIPSIFALWQFFTNNGLSIPLEGIYNRIYGTFAHPNLLAYYLVMPIILGLFLFLNGNRKKISSLLFLIFSLFLILILALTFTRGAWLCLIIIIAILGTVRYRQLLLVAILSICLIFMFSGTINKRVNDLLANRSGNSIEWRFNLWNDAKEYAKEKPFFGHGTGLAKELILEKRGEKFGSSDPHNDYLKILIENGFFGLLAYLILIAGLIVSLFKKYILTQQPIFRALLLLALSLSFAFYLLSSADNILRNTALQWSFWALMGGIMTFKK